MPSYVDDVIERTDFASLPTTGETGKIYITTGNNKQYRWSGTAYVELVSSPGSTDAVPEGSTNKYFTEARVRTTPLTGYTLGSNATLASTDTILAALGKVQGQLNGKATTAQGAKADTALQPGANLSALTNDLALISQEAGDGRYTRRSQNLADLDNATTARANLDLIKTGNPLDMTSNRMLMTGDAGLLTFSAPLASANLQETIIPATYRVGGSESNSLKPGAAGVLRVEAYSDSIFTQYFTQNPISSPSAPSPILYRQVRAGVWSTTAEFWTTANDANLAKKDTAQTFSDSITINKNGSAVFSHQRGTDAADMYNDGAGGAVLRSRTATPAHLRVLTVKANYSAPQFYNAATALTYDVWTTAALSTTTVGYLSGLTSDVQTQLNGKAPATVEQNTRNASYTLAVTDNNKHIYHSNSSAYTWTIPPNSSVAFPIGATVTFVNDGSGNVTIAQGSGVTIVEAGNGTTGNKNLGAAGMATALKVGTDRWFLNGAGIY